MWKSARLRRNFGTPSQERRLPTRFPFPGEPCIIKRMTRTLSDGMQYLTRERRIVSGVAVGYGNADTAKADCRGNAEEVALLDGAFVPRVREMDAETIFDLASVTKLFTALSIVLLRERGKLRFTDPVSRYDARFAHIGDTTVYEMLCFRAGLRTDARIDEAADRETALQRLFNVRPTPLPPVRYYTDMGSMTLKYIVEAASGMAYYDFVKANILDPFTMRTTFARVPDTLLARTVCYNYERRIVGGEYRVDTACPTGTVHDPKARVLCDGGRDLCGHAGLFSTMGDMARLAQGLLNDALFSHEILREIGANRTGYPLPGGGHTQYLGYLCYAKHPEQTYSEVPACFGERTLALNGFTGNHFSVDPEKNQYMIILANRIHNRITVATGRPDPNDPTVSLRWDDGKEYPVSQNYTYLKDPLLKEPMGELLAEM